MVSKGLDLGAEFPLIKLYWMPPSPGGGGLKGTQQDALWKESLQGAPVLWQAHDDVGWKKRFLFRRARRKLVRELTGWTPNNNIYVWGEDPLVRLQSAQHLGSAFMRSWDNWEAIASKYKASLSLSQGVSLGKWREMEEKGNRRR